MWLWWTMRLGSNCRRGNTPTDWCPRATICACCWCATRIMLHCHSTQPSKATATAEHHACQIGMVGRYIVLPEHIGVAVQVSDADRSSKIEARYTVHVSKLEVRAVPLCHCHLLLPDVSQRVCVLPCSYTHVHWCAVAASQPKGAASPRSEVSLALGQ